MAVGATSTVSVLVMVLFEVPDWSVASEPVRHSKKRKRPQKNEQQIHAAAINFDKIVKKLKTKPQSANPDSHAVRVDKGSSERVQAEGRDKKRKKMSAVQSVPPSPSSPSQKKLKKHDVSISSSDGTTAELTALQQNMKRTLNGARFRYGTLSVTFVELNQNFKDG
jgi:hypothetical protein